MNHKCFDVLIVGCGNIAGRYDMSKLQGTQPLSHAGAFSHHGGFRICGCVEPDVDRRESFARYWGVELQAASLKELSVEPGAFDVISICSPTALHHEHIVQALAMRPRVIFCEKPLTSAVDSASLLVNACRKAGVKLIVNFNRHWDPYVADFETQLKGGRWGKVRSAIGHYNKGIHNNGSHMIDLLSRLLGPLEIVAALHVYYDFMPTDPTVSALLSADRGKIPVYLNPAHSQDFAFFELEIVCELGVVRMLSGGMNWVFREAVPSSQYSNYRSLNAGFQEDGRYMETMANAIDSIHHYLISGEPVGNTGEHALEIQKLCMRIQREAEANRLPIN